MDKAIYKPNYQFICNLSDYGVTQREIARFLNISDAAVSQKKKTLKYSMLDIEGIACVGGFSLGNFQRIVGQGQEIIIIVPERKPVTYRLHLLVADLVQEYGSLLNVSKETGVSQDTLRMMKVVTHDEAGYYVTSTEVLAKVQFSDYLTLFSALSFDDQTRYIYEPNGPFPVRENHAGMMPVPAHLSYKQAMEEKLHEITVVNDELTQHYNAMCEKNRESEIIADSLFQRLAALERKLEKKGREVSGKNSDIKKLRNLIYQRQEVIRKMLIQVQEGKGNRNELIESIIRMIDQDHESIEKEYGD